MARDPRLASVELLTLAAMRARQRHAPAPVLRREFPPGWWGAFVRVCCRELPEHGRDMLVSLGTAEAEVVALCTMSEEAFAAWQAQQP